MKNNKIKLSILCLSILSIFCNIKITYAEETSKNLNIDLSQINLYDKFEYNGYNYTVSQVNSSDIYIDDEQIDIYNFEVEVSNGDIQTWRKYVKFNDLCSDEKICEDFSENGTIALRRTYSETINNNDIYYTTKYINDSKSFESRLIIGDNSYNFNAFKDENSIFNEQGVLIADVEPLTDSNNDLYVSLRFVTEALGAEVIWTEEGYDEGRDKVSINFYDSDKYCKVINTSYTESCKNIDEEELNNINNCDSNDDKCLSDRCKEYINENIDDLDDSFEITTNYNYIDINNKLRKFEAKYKKEEVYIDNDKLYIIIMYNGVPLPYNIFDESANENCKDEFYEEKLKCLEEGKSWITDENMIKLSEKDGPFCGIELEKISQSADK